MCGLDTPQGDGKFDWLPIFIKTEIRSFSLSFYNICFLLEKIPIKGYTKGQALVIGVQTKNCDYWLKMLCIVCVARNYLLFLSFYLVSIQNLASKLQKS